ncbi:hypothetical protein DMH25_22840 [Streptomyces sp. WAC 01325]|nr:hypothetical protein DMH25_22840 [Streptomyces sp. WAC 01325]
MPLVLLCERGGQVVRVSEQFVGISGLASRHHEAAEVPVRVEQIEKYSVEFGVRDTDGCRVWFQVAFPQGTDSPAGFAQRLLCPDVDISVIVRLRARSAHDPSPYLAAFTFSASAPRAETAR